MYDLDGWPRFFASRTLVLFDALRNVKLSVIAFILKRGYVETDKKRDKQKHNQKYSVGHSMYFLNRWGDSSFTPLDFPLNTKIRNLRCFRHSRDVSSDVIIIKRINFFFFNVTDVDWNPRIHLTKIEFKDNVYSYLLSYYYRNNGKTNVIAKNNCQEIVIN